MFCSQCGTQLNDDAKFCKECGTKTAAGKAEAAAAQRAPAAAPRPADAPRRAARPAAAAAFPDESAGRTRVVLAVVAILALAGVGFFLWKTDSPSSGTTPVAAPGTDEGVQKGIAEIDRIPSGLDIAGTITVGPGITPPASGALYVMARPAATPEQRSPLAVEKINPTPGGSQYIIGPDNLMTGGTFDQPVVIAVRWDQDGDPLTKQIGDITGAAGPFKPGDTGANIVLDQKIEEAEIHPGLIDGSVPGAIAAANGDLMPEAPYDEAESAPADEEPASAPADEEPAAPADDAPPGGIVDGAPTKITGRILLGEGVKAPADGTVFVIARNPGSAAGPPVAVARLTPGAQGLTYTIGPENVMMGGPFTGPYEISARWDQDGNAMSKQPGDLSGAAKKPASPGQTADITLDTVNE